MDIFHGQKQDNFWEYVKTTGETHQLFFWLSRDLAAREPHALLKTVARSPAEARAVAPRPSPSRSRPRPKRRGRAAPAAAAAAPGGGGGGREGSNRAKGAHA
eukprot:10867886-Lingulodinium_polyedra.AAC.2